MSPEKVYSLDKSPERASRSHTVLLFGEVLADIFPDRTVLGGAPFNVARHLKAFGQSPVLVSSLGSDTLREDVLDVMRRCEMTTVGIQLDELHPTGRVQVHMQHGGHRFDILPLQAYDFIDTAELRNTLLAVRPDLVYFGTLAQRHNVSRQSLETLLLSAKAERFLDINLRTPWYEEEVIGRSLRYADMIKLNDDELDILADMLKLQGSSPESQAIDLMRQFDIGQAVITCGEAGAWHISGNGNITTAEVKNKISGLVDTVGAGDGFAATYILGSLMRWPIEKTLDRAIAFAGAICEIRGAVPDHEDFYDSFTREWNI
jgi:fructokinase